MAGIVNRIKALKAKARTQSGKIRSVAAAKNYARNFARRKSSGGSGG